MNVLLGVTGGVAAYKSCELVRRLRERGHDVQVVMTQAATRFVQPLLFEALSGRQVATSLFDAAPDSSIEHIRLARWPRLIVVAPATANTIARLAHGFADDLLSTIVLASRSDVPVVLAPAMNTVMWENPLVQRNLGTLVALERFGVVAPREGELACGEVGAGAMAEEAAILAVVDEVLATRT